MATVLIVDDEDILLEMIAALIEDIGHQSILATNGEDALALLGQNALPSLILSDIMMPRMNGLELVAMLKRDVAWRTIPVVLMSAAGRPRIAHLADAFIHKPFDLDMLEDIIERYLVKKPS